MCPDITTRQRQPFANARLLAGSRNPTYWEIIVGVVAIIGGPLGVAKAVKETKKRLRRRRGVDPIPAPGRDDGALVTPDPAFDTAAVELRRSVDGSSVLRINSDHSNHVPNSLQHARASGPESLLSHQPTGVPGSVAENTDQDDSNVPFSGSDNLAATISYMVGRPQDNPESMIVVTNEEMTNGTTDPRSSMDVELLTNPIISELNTYMEIVTPAVNIPDAGVLVPFQDVAPGLRPHDTPEILRIIDGQRRGSLDYVAGPTRVAAVAFGVSGAAAGAASNPSDPTGVASSITRPQPCSATILAEDYIATSHPADSEVETSDLYSQVPTRGSAPSEASEQSTLVAESTQDDDDMAAVALGTSRGRSRTI